MFIQKEVVKELDALLEEQTQMDIKMANFQHIRWVGVNGGDY